jgi:uncharacterized protein (DUF302 family)
LNNIGNFALQITTSLSFEDTIAKATEFLKDEGFGVLTEIHVKKTMKEKLDIDFKPFRILGACNPAFAHRSLSAVPEVSVLLPCNVVVWDEGSHRVVSVMEPRIMSQIIDNPLLKVVAEEVSAKLHKVINRLEEFTQHA